MTDRMMIGFALMFAIVAFVLIVGLYLTRESRGRSTSRRRASRSRRRERAARSAAER